MPDTLEQFDALVAVLTQMVAIAPPELAEATTEVLSYAPILRKQLTPITRAALSALDGEISSKIGDERRRLDGMGRSLDVADVMDIVFPYLKRIRG